MLITSVDKLGLDSLEKKYESYEVFSIFLTKVNFEKELKNFKVRSDHGGEFENKLFKNLL